MQQHRGSAMFVGMVCALVLLSLVTGLAMTAPGRGIWLQIFMATVTGCFSMQASCQMFRISVGLESYAIFFLRNAAWIAAAITMGLILGLDSLQNNLEELNGAEAIYAQASVHTLTIFELLVYAFGLFHMLRSTYWIMSRYRQASSPCEKSNKDSEG